MPHEGLVAQATHYTGYDLAVDLHDVLDLRIRRLALDDPLRPVFVQTRDQLSRLLVRPRLQVVAADPEAPV